MLGLLKSLLLFLTRVGQVITIKAKVTRAFSTSMEVSDLISPDYGCPSLQRTEEEFWNNLE